MLNEIEEFKAYTGTPIYSAASKRDTTWLGRFTFDTLMDFEGIGRVLTIVARGYLFQGDGDPYDHIEQARNALCAWCSVPEKTKKAPEAGTEPKVNFGYLSSDFPELVDKKGNGWFHRHVKNIIKFVRNHSELVSKSNQKNAEKLAQGFSTAWKKKVRQLQIPAFALNTKAAWCLRFDDILADALEQGPLQNYELALSQKVIDRLKTHTPKGFPDMLLPMMMQYYLSRGGETEEWVVLPVSAVDAYYGTTTFSRKKKTLPKDIIKFKEAYGICKFKMTL